MTYMQPNDPATALRILEQLTAQPDQRRRSRPPSSAQLDYEALCDDRAEDRAARRRGDYDSDRDHTALADQRAADQP